MPGDSGDVVVQLQERLATLSDLPVAEHVDVFDGVHRRLQDALAALDEA